MRAPVTRMGWHGFYARRFCRTRSEAAEQMACWYFMLAVADEEVA